MPQREKYSREYKLEALAPIHQRGDQLRAASP